MLGSRILKPFSCAGNAERVATGEGVSGGLFVHEGEHLETGVA